MNIKINVVVIVAIFLGILLFSTTCGCTHGGVYGLYEGLTDIASSAIGSGPHQINLNVTKERGYGGVRITPAGSGSGSHAVGSGSGSGSHAVGSGEHINIITPIVHRESFNSSGTGTGTSKQTAPKPQASNPKSTAPSKTVPVTTVTKPKGSSKTNVASSTPAPVKKEAFTSLTGEPSNSLWGIPEDVPNYVSPANNNPLSYGELSMFANTPFKPECCPSTYSTSTGCACISNDQYGYLLSRGGNNVPFAN